MRGTLELAVRFKKQQARLLNPADQHVWWISVSRGAEQPAIPPLSPQSSAKQRIF